MKWQNYCCHFLVSKDIGNPQAWQELCSSGWVIGANEGIVQFSSLKSENIRDNHDHHQSNPTNSK